MKSSTQLLSEWLKRSKKKENVKPFKSVKIEPKEVETQKVKPEELETKNNKSNYFKGNK
jgi:hypothetical protein